MQDIPWMINHETGDFYFRYVHQQHSEVLVFFVQSKHI